MMGRRWLRGEVDGRAAVRGDVMMTVCVEERRRRGDGYSLDVVNVAGWLMWGRGV